MGFRLLAAVDPTGVVTGFGFCSASTADQQVAETFFEESVPVGAC